MQTISLYSVRMQENKDYKSSEYQHLLCSGTKHNNYKNADTNGSFEALLCRFFINSIHLYPVLTAASNRLMIFIKKIFF